MRPQRKIFLSYFALIVLLSFAGTARGDRPLSDGEKKKTVYRVYAEYKTDFPNVRDISPQQAMDLLNRGSAVFVDTRRPAEMAVSMLPGAVAEKEFIKEPDRYRDKSIIAYCTISYRSGVFARELAQKEITVINLQGGILAWLLEGGKVYDQNRKEVKKVHVYGDKWDYAPAGYDTVKFSLSERLF